LRLKLPPVEAIFELEDSLCEPAFMGVPIGRTLNDFVIFNLHREGLPLTPNSGALYWARYHYRMRRGFPSSPIPRGVPEGQILVTCLSQSPRMADLVLPVVQRLGPERCVIVGNPPQKDERLDCGVTLVPWGCATSPLNLRWIREYRKCAPVWHARAREWVGRMGLPWALLPTLRFELLWRSFQVAGSMALLDRLRPRAVVAEADRNAYTSCLVLSAKALGILTMTMVHGVINPPYGYTPLLADVAFCWGEQQRELMVQMGTEPERLVVTGCQRLRRGFALSRESALSRIGLPTDLPVVMLASSPISVRDRRRFARAFCQALGSHREILSLVRLHPSEQADFYRAERAEFPSVRFLESGSWPVEEALAATDVVVCQNSGLGNDALVADRLTVVLDVGDETLKNGKELVEKAGCPLAHSPEELVVAIERIFSDGEFRRSLEESRDRFVGRFCAAFGDEAADRIAAEVESRLPSGRVPTPERGRAECPVCGADSRYWGSGEDHHYRNNGRWAFHECLTCGHVFQAPMPEEKSLGPYYPEGYYAHHEPGLDFTPSGLRRRSEWLRMHFLKRHRGYGHLPVSGNPLWALMWTFWPGRPVAVDSLRFKAGGTCLDYGCGSGETVAYLNHLGWNGEGIEISGGAVAAANAVGLPVERGSVEVLEPRKARYDSILSTHCVEHVVDVRGLFRAFFTALKPGGTLVVEVPNGDALSREQYGEMFYYLGAPVHVHLFSERSLVQIARDSGFVNLSTWTRSVWICHYAPKALVARLRKDPEASKIFEDAGRGERWRAQILSLPEFIRSHRRGRGDSLFLMAERPIPSP
jgi:SAM-dependent methyltransferase